MTGWRILLVGFTCLFFQQVYSQHNVNFQIPAQVCKGETLTFENSSDPGTTSNWSFCSTLEGTYTSTPHGTVTLSFASMSMIESGGLWYGFAISRNNELLRLNFGDNPANTNYTIFSLGNPGGLLNSPDWIHVISSGANWYALITNQGNNEIIRLTWTSLTAVPSAQSLNLGSSGKFVAPAQIQIVEDGGNYVAVVANSGSNQLSLINFGASMENMPAVTDVLQSPVFPGATNMYGVTVTRICDQWEIYTTVTDRLFKVNVGSAIFTSFTAAQIVDFSADIPLTIGSYNRMKSVIVDGGLTYVYFTSYSGNYLAAAIWSAGATHALYKNLSYLTLPAQLYSLEIYQDGGAYGIYVGSFNSGTLQYIGITSVCNANKNGSPEQLPTGIYYTNPGTYSVGLTVSYADGTSCYATQQIVVTSDQAPDISFISLNNCAQHDVDFTTTNVSGNLNTYAWDFGDSGTSSVTNPTHQYAAAGIYNALLTVTATNGCQNIAKDSTKIYSPPIAGFNLPSTSPICTNQDYLLVNTSSYDAKSQPIWQWNVNGTDVSSNQNFDYIITSTAPQTVILSATIPGCNSVSTQTISTIIGGPSVDFTTGLACQSSPLLFTNTTVGSGLSYTWNFGDGNTSTAPNTSNTYSSFGNFQVSLVASSSNGCQNSQTKLVPVYSKPQPDFNLALPPFSCNNSPSQFSDATPNLTDSNIAAWAWTFGDANAGTSNQQNPTYIYSTAGNFTAGLTVTTNYNCSASIQKQITIAQSPTANFSNIPACLNQNTQFTDLSSSTVKSRLWTISSGATTLPNSTLSNPVYVFNNAASYNAILTVTDNNTCISKVSKTITVPIPLAPDFTTQIPCAGEQTIFTDATPVIADPPVSWAWNFDGKGSGTGSPTDFTFAATGNPSVTMTTTAQSGCVYAVTKVITIYSTPVASFTTPLSAGAPPFDVPFTNTSTNATSYLWSFGDAANSTSTITSPEFTYNVLANDTVKLTAFGTHGCSDTFSKIIQVVLPSVDLALDKLELIPDPITGSLQVIIQIENKGNAPVSNPTIQFNISGSASIEQSLNVTIPSGQSVYQTLSYKLLPASGNYVCLTVEEPKDVNLNNNELCSTLLDEDVVFAPYPNPTSGQLYFDWISASAAIGQITIYSTLGQTVLSSAVNAASGGLNHFNIDVSNLHAGIFIILFKYEGHQKSFRFIVD